MKLFALLITVATAIGLVVVPAASGVGADPNATVVFSALGSGIVAPGADITLTGSITNNSPVDIVAGTATAYLDRGLVVSRTDLTEWSGSANPIAADQLGSEVAIASTPPITSGATVAVSVLIPAAAVGLAPDAAWGVRRISVRVTAANQEVGQSRSSIVWNSANTTTPLSLAFATPLTVPATTDGLINAATLATYTGPTGLLTRQLDQAIDHHIAIGVDPMLIVSIRLLGSSAPLSARQWLDRLAAATNETFPLTYSDSDVAAASQGGASTLLAPISFVIDPALFPGSTPPPTATPTVSPTPNPLTTPAPVLWTTKTITNWSYTAALSNLVWPTDDTVAEKDLARFGAAGFTTTILSSGNVTFTNLDYSPNAAASVEKRPVSVSDAELSRLFRVAAAAADDAQWQKAMADLSAGIAVVANQTLGGAREMLATMDRSNPGSGNRLAQTLQALGTLPWANLGKLADVVGSTSRVDAGLVPKAEPADRVTIVRNLLDSETQIGSFSSILAQPELLTGERRLGLLAVLSNSWNSQLANWRPQATRFLSSSAKTLASVKIARTGSQALLSDTVNLGVAVTNDLAFPVTVSVTVTSPTGVIQVKKSPISLTIEANSQAKALVPVTALANGDVVLNASLASASGVPVGRASTLHVNVQAGWESAFTAAFAVLVFAVFGLGIYRSIRKRRKRVVRTAAEDSVE